VEDEVEREGAEVEECCEEAPVLFLVSRYPGMVEAEEGADVRGSQARRGEG
jgi:hypothetical protein